MENNLPGPTEAQLQPIRKWYAASLRYEKNSTEENNVITSDLFNLIPDQPGYAAYCAEQDANDEGFNEDALWEKHLDNLAWERSMREPAWAR